VKNIMGYIWMIWKMVRVNINGLMVQPIKVFFIMKNVKDTVKWILLMEPITKENGLTVKWSLINLIINMYEIYKGSLAQWFN